MSYGKLKPFDPNPFNQGDKVKIKGRPAVITEALPRPAIEVAWIGNPPNDLDQKTWIGFYYQSAVEYNIGFSINDVFPFRQENESPEFEYGDKIMVGDLEEPFYFAAKAKGFIFGYSEDGFKVVETGRLVHPYSFYEADVSRWQDGITVHLSGGIPAKVTAEGFELVHESFGVETTFSKSDFDAIAEAFKMLEQC